MATKISIIIPAYNVQGYISKCLESCLDQNLPYPEYEIIVIDDGSIDKTAETVKEYALKYSNIKLRSKQNEGPGQARNDGISLANGEFIWFVDADDWIAPNCLLKIFSIASAYELDMLWFKLERINEEGGKISTSMTARSQNTGVLTGLQFLDKVMGFSLYAFLFLIRKQFLLESNVRFTKNVYYEDAEFIHKLIISAQRVKYDPRVVYYYAIRKNSLIQASDQRKIDDMLKVILSIKSTNAEYINNRLGYFNLLISKMILDIVRLVSNPEYKIKQRQLIVHLKSHNLTKVLVVGSFNQKIQAVIFNLSPVFFLKLCMFLRLIGSAKK